MMSDRQQQGVFNAGQGTMQSEVRQHGVREDSLRGEGVSLVDRPRHRQLSCETCSLRLEPNQNRVQCSACRFWIHERCVERLKFGTSFQATMCLICKQKAVRMIRVVDTVESSQGQRWDQDEWFERLLVAVRVGSSYAISNNTDLNKLELFMANALVNGLQYQQEQSEHDQAAGDEGDQSVGTEQASERATPIARPGFLPRPGFFA